MSHDPPPQNPKYSSYPTPEEAAYREIIETPEIFLQKLQDFHLSYGSRFRIPTLGGNRLDLHQLFVEVTSRGGIEKVIKERRWKEVTGAFNFPSTITSASFVLRKYYLSLLYDFEQVYYLRKEKPSISTSDQASRSTNGNAIDDETSTDQLTASPILEEGSFVTGTIDGKFDNGYLITVSYGGEDLKGVLYHHNIPVGKNASKGGRRARRKKHRMGFKDPAYPRRNRSGYTFFFAEQYHNLRPEFHGQERAISKKIGQLWSSLSETERQVYQEKGLRDKERYKAEMLEYKSTHASPAPPLL
ncbi:hypothetical protein M569_09756 [Genlisea aurea]|uniref:Uncharacterized protein n=1 Tax=Genlisea aurea TaxID=192259 RepID=S8CDT6_9LAMI|nr:hypothetical protein M569_09756 [Genlisea aurea]